MGSRAPVTRVRDGREWRIGDREEIAWIQEGTSITKAITSAIPPVFEAYATLELPGTGSETGEWIDDQHRHDRAVVGLLCAHTALQPWWLGYLDCDGYGVVFSDAPRLTLYADWHYELVQAGPEQAATWRQENPSQKGGLPDLMFPADRSWLVSTLWDDDWTCFGGSAALVEDLLGVAAFRARARQVALDQDATPPGHEAR